MVGFQNLAFLVKPITVVIAGNLLLSACADIPDACGFGFSHGDCPLFPGETAQFPSDDVICRSYGLSAGSASYERCRIAKASVRAETKAKIDTDWWKNGL